MTLTEALLAHERLLFHLGDRQLSDGWKVIIQEVQEAERLKRAYSVFEEASPPDVPRADREQKADE